MYVLMLGSVIRTISHSNTALCQTPAHNTLLLPHGAMCFCCRFQLVGYGCMTCIGNSGPLPEEVVKAIDEMDLVAVGILSGNRQVSLHMSHFYFCLYITYAIFAFQKF